MRRFCEAAADRLSPHATWCLATEPERWARRLASSMAEMQAFYDACFPRAEEAIAAIAQAGYEGVELMLDAPHLFPADATPRKIESIRRAD